MSALDGSIFPALGALLLAVAPSPPSACPDSIRAVDMEEFLIAERAPDPAQCLQRVVDGRTVDLLSVQYGDLDDEAGEEAVVRAQTCAMGSGGADISAVFKLECSGDGRGWSLAGIPVEELAHDRGPGSPRTAPQLTIEGRELVSSTLLYRAGTSNPAPSWERIVTYSWSDGRFVVKSVTTRELDRAAQPVDLGALVEDALSAEDYKRRREVHRRLRELPPTEARAAIERLEAVLVRGAGSPGGAALALSQMGTPGGECLHRHLDHPDPRVREQAAAFLGGVEPPFVDAIPDLVALLDNRFSPVSRRAAGSLQRMGPAAAPAVPTVIEILQEQPNSDDLVELLAAIGPAAAPAVPTLLAILQDAIETPYPRPRRSVRCTALDAMAAIGPEAAAAVPVLVDGLDQHEFCDQVKVANTLAAIGAPAVPTLRQATGNPRKEVRLGATLALQAMAAEVPASEAGLMAALRDADVEVRSTAVKGLGLRATETSMQALLAALQDPNAYIRSQASRWLSRSDRPEIRQALARYETARRAEATETARGSLRTRDQIRAPVPPSAEHIEPLELLQDLEVPAGPEHRVRVTVHGNRKSGYYRMALWRRQDECYALIREFNDGILGAGTFRYRDQLFLHLFQTHPAAGHYWSGHAVYWVAPDGTLHEVRLASGKVCGSSLPEINSEFTGSSYGSDYQLEDDRLAFDLMVWKPGDGPNFPSGGRYAGTLDITGEPGLDPQTGRYQPTFRFAIASCRKLEDED